MKYARPHQLSVVLKGQFRQSGHKFDDIKVIYFIKWNNGYIRVLDAVHTDYQKIIKAVETPAEKYLSELQCMSDECLDKVKERIEEKCEFKFVNFYPTNLLMNILNTTAQSLKITNVDGVIHKEDSNIVLRGKVGFNIIAQSNIKHFVEQHILTIKILHSDDTTVVTATILTPKPNMLLSDFTSVHELLQDSLIVYTTHKFTEQGKLSQVESMYNRPLLPWEVRRLQQQYRMDQALDKVLQMINEKGSK